MSVHRDHHSHRNTCHNVARLDDQFCYSATETNRKTLQTRIDNFYQNELPFRKTRVPLDFLHCGYFGIRVSCRHMSRQLLLC